MSHFATTAHPSRLHSATSRKVLGIGLALMLAAALPLITEAPVAFADPVQVGSGSYTTDKVGTEPGERADFCTTTPRTPFALGSRTIPALSAKDAPIPTNDWWSSLVFRKRVQTGGQWSCSFGSRLYANPGVYGWHARGLGITYSDAVSGAQNPGGAIPNYSGQGYEYRGPAPDGHDIYAGSGRSSGSPSQEFEGSKLQVTDWTDWTVASELKNESEQAGVRSIVGRGMPITWIESFGSGSGPGSRVYINGTPTSQSNIDGTLIVSINGRTYVAWAPHGSQWQDRGLGVFTSATGRYAVAIVPDGANAAEIAAQWKQFAYSPVTSTTLDYTYNQTAGTLEANYNIGVTRYAGSGSTTSTVMALFPHQEQYRSDNSVARSQTYVSPRGQMTILDNVSGFSTATPFHGVMTEIPGLTTTPGEEHHDQLLDYLDEVRNDPLNQSMVEDNGDATYWTGKAVGRAARIAELADQVGDIDARDKALAAIRSTLSDWFTATPGKTQKVFAYSENFGTLLGYPAGPGGGDQYGTLASMNDHHFHYAYYITAAATLARFDQQWAQNYGGMVEMLIRDTASPDHDDPMFPFLRTFDIYAGHSWASGDGGDTHGNNQEASSEAMNLAQAMIQWGEITGNTSIRDTGIYLYTTEATSALRYWFNAEGDFPASGPYAKNYASMVWANGAHYSLWFGENPITGNEHEFFYGINMLPVTGGSLYLGYYPDVVQRTYDEFTVTNGQPEPKYWHDILYSYLALTDGEQALAKFQATNANNTYAVESGESRAHTFHWLTSLAALGQVDTKVTANYPMATTFNKGGQRSYVVTNVSNKDIEVTFRDESGAVVAEVTAPKGKVTTRKPDGSVVSLGDGSSGGTGIAIPSDPDDGGNPGNGGTKPPVTTPPPTDNSKTNAKKRKAKVVNIKVTKGRHKDAKRPARTIKVRTAARVRVALRAPKKTAVRGKVRLRVGKRVIGKAKLRKKGKNWVAVVRVKKSANKTRGKVRVVYPGSKLVRKQTFKTKVRVAR